MPKPVINIHDLGKLGVKTEDDLRVAIAEYYKNGYTVVGAPKEEIDQLAAEGGYPILPNQPKKELAPMGAAEYLRKSTVNDPSIVRPLSRMTGNGLNGMWAGRFLGPKGMGAGAIAGILGGELLNAAGEYIGGKDKSPVNWNDAANAIPLPFGKASVPADALIRATAAGLNGGSMGDITKAGLVTGAAGYGTQKLLGGAFNKIKQAAEAKRGANEGIIDFFRSMLPDAPSGGVSNVVKNAQELSAELGDGTRRNRVGAAIKDEATYPKIQEKHNFAREKEKLDRAALQRQLAQQTDEKDLALDVVREARDKALSRELGVLESELQNEISWRGNSVKAKEIRAKMEQVKNSYAAPSAREQQLLSQQNRLMAPEALEDFDNQTFISGQKRTAEAQRYEAQTSYLNDLSERTGLDVRNLSGEQVKTINELATKNPDTFYGDVVGHLFQDKTLQNMREKGAPAFKGMVDQVRKISGKNHAEVVDGIRTAFFKKVFDDVDPETGLLKNPVSLKYRIEAMGPDAFNQLFSKSPDIRNEGGAAYDTMMNLLKIAGKESAKRNLRNRIGFTGSGRFFVSWATPKREAIDIHLDKDQMNLRKYVGSLGHGFITGAGIGSGIGGIFGGLAGAGKGFLIGGGIGGATAGAVDGYQWNVQKLLESASGKNSVIARTIQVLANPEMYSSATVNAATRNFIAMADSQKKAENDKDPARKAAVGKVMEYLQR